MQKRRKMPTDPSKLAKAIIDIATGAAPFESSKDPQAVEIGRKGGAARAASLSKRRKRAIAKKAAAARWGRRKASTP